MEWKRKNSGENLNMYDEQAKNKMERNKAVFRKKAKRGACAYREFHTDDVNVTSRISKESNSGRLHGKQTFYH